MSYNGQAEPETSDGERQKIALLYKRRLAHFPQQISNGGGDADAEGPLTACPVYSRVYDLGTAGFDHKCVLAARLQPERLAV